MVVVYHPSPDLMQLWGGTTTSHRSTMLLSRCGVTAVGFPVLSVPRRWGSTDVEERRRRKAEMKEAEAMRARAATTGHTTKSMQPTVSTARARFGRGVRGEGYFSMFKKEGALVVLKEVWYGRKGRGGGLREQLLSGFLMFASLVGSIGPIFYFFYDDGRTTVTTRFAIAESVPDGAVVLDVGCGNADLTRIVGEQLKPSGGKVIAVDLDKNRVRDARQLMKNRKLDNVEVRVMDACSLDDDLKEAGVTHAVLGMVLHELDPAKRLLLLEQLPKVVKDEILVLDFAPLPSSWWNMLNWSHRRNQLMEFIAGHYGMFDHWMATGGLPGLVEELEKGRNEGRLEIPRFTISKTHLMDRGTHAVYTISLDRSPPPPTSANPQPLQGKRKSFWG
eukprot:Sspe_Gene.54847::Locus_30225_Transcript_2_2_Confidence_0.750_Length_1349::g.54847::m.54847